MSHARYNNGDNEVHIDEEKLINRPGLQVLEARFDDCKEFLGFIIKNGSNFSQSGSICLIIYNQKLSLNMLKKK